jgi:hypothetical protein
MFITGDGYLAGFGVENEEPGRWSFVWRDELRVKGDGTVTHILAPGVPPDTLKLTDDNYKEVPPKSVVAYRMWTPHPRLSGMADSPMRSVLDVGEELLILTKNVHATATSRLTRDMLLIPTEISPPTPDVEGDEDPLNNVLIERVADTFAGQIENPSPRGRIRVPRQDPDHQTPRPADRLPRA